VVERAFVLRWKMRAISSQKVEKVQVPEFSFFRAEKLHRFQDEKFFQLQQLNFDERRLNIILR